MTGVSLLKKQSVKTAKTVEEATALACAELGVEVSDVPAEDIHVLHYPKKSFFSFLKPDYAEVEVVLEISKLNLALEYIQSILKDMDLESVNVSVSEQTEGASAVLLLEGESVGTLIGRHGETLDALQYLTGLVANKAEGDYFRISLDSGNYREKRKKTLESLARRMAVSAAKTGRSMTLEPMNPYERRIIHSTVQEVEGATSTSIGEEPNRRVVIKSTNPRPKRQKNDFGRSGGKGAEAARVPTAGSAGMPVRISPCRSGSANLCATVNLKSQWKNTAPLQSRSRRSRRSVPHLRIRRLGMGCTLKLKLTIKATKRRVSCETLLF